MYYSVLNPKEVSFQREPGEPKIYKESTLYYKIKKIFLDAGYDVVRQVPEKDGHMTGAPYYIRDRKGRFCWIDNNYAIRSLTEPYNAGEEFTLMYCDLTK